MKRTVDINSVVAQIRTLEASIHDTISKYQAYHAEVGASVKIILEKAGVWDAVHDLEQERERVRQQADQKIKGVQVEIEKLNQIHTWLMNQEGDVEMPEASSQEPTPSAEPSEKVETHKPEKAEEKPAKTEPTKKVGNAEVQVEAEEKILRRPALPKF